MNSSKMMSGALNTHKENSKSLLNKSFASGAGNKAKAGTPSKSRDDMKTKAINNSKMMLLSDSDSDGNDGLIFSDDEATVTSERKDNTNNKDDDANKGSGEIEELKGGDGGVEEIKKKARNVAKPFTEDVLCSTDGLTRIYEEFPPIYDKKESSRGNEANDLKKLMLRYTEWAHQLYPGLNFTDLVGKCEDFSSKGRVKSELDKLRDRERCRYLVDVMGVSRTDILIQNKKAKTRGDVTSPEELSSPDFMKELKSNPGHASALQYLNDDGDFDYDFINERDATVQLNRNNNALTSAMVTSVVDEEDYEAEFEAATQASRQGSTGATYNDNTVMTISQSTYNEPEIDDFLLVQMAEAEEARISISAATVNADSLPMSQDLPPSYSYNSSARHDVNSSSSHNDDDPSSLAGTFDSSSKRMSVEENMAGTQDCDMSICIDVPCGASVEEEEGDRMVESSTQADGAPDDASSSQMDV